MPVILENGRIKVFCYVLHCDDTDTKYGEKHEVTLITAEKNCLDPSGLGMEHNTCETIHKKNFQQFPFTIHEIFREF